MLQTGWFEFTILDFSDFEFILALVCFGFRASNFGFTLVDFVSDFRYSDFEFCLAGPFDFAQDMAGENFLDWFCQTFQTIGSNKMVPNCCSVKGAS